MKRNPLAGLGLFDKSFWRILLPLALPIALQNLLMTSFRLVDTLMIGRLGDVSIAAVGLAGQASFLVELVAFGMASGSAVFIAQYHGAGDLDGIRRTFYTYIYFPVRAHRHARVPAVPRGDHGAAHGRPGADRGGGRATSNMRAGRIWRLPSTSPCARRCAARSACDCR